MGLHLRERIAVGEMAVAGALEQRRDSLLGTVVRGACQNRNLLAAIAAHGLPHLGKDLIAGGRQQGVDAVGVRRPDLP